MSITITLLIQGLAFFAVAWLVMQLGWPLINKAIEERQAKIASGLAAADRGQKDLEDAQAKAQEIIKDARSRAQVLVDQAAKRSNELVEEAKPGRATPIDQPGRPRRDLPPVRRRRRTNGGPL